MTTLLWIAGTFAALVGGDQVLLNGRGRRLLLNQLSRVGRSADAAADPAAGLQRVADRMKDNVEHARDALVEGYAITAAAKDRIAGNRAEMARAERAVKDMDAVGSTNEKLAQDYADLYARASAAVTADEAVLAKQEAANAALLTKAQAAADEIEGVEAEARQLGVAVKTAAAREAFATMSSRFGGAGDLRAEAQRLRDLAADRVRRADASEAVAGEFTTAADRVAAHERAAAGKTSLADLRAKIAAKTQTP